MWVPIEDYFCSHGFQNMMVKEKERMEGAESFRWEGEEGKKEGILHCMDWRVGLV